MLTVMSLLIMLSLLVARCDVEQTVTSRCRRQQ